MKNYCTAFAAVVCALTTSVTAHDPTDTSAPGTDYEYLPCWSDAPDPQCNGNQYLDRSGLQDWAAVNTEGRSPTLVEASTADPPIITCQCIDLPQSCPQGQIWDYQNDECVCVATSVCAANYYFDYNKCGCECVPFNACDDGFHWSSNKCRCVCDPDVPPAAIANTVWGWNEDQCDWECFEDDADLCVDIAEGKYYSVALCACIDGWKQCDPNEYFDFESNSCKCAPTCECGTNEHWDTEVCECRCNHLDCPEDYNFNNESCQCDCLEPSATPCLENEYWSTELCDCICLPPAGGCTKPDTHWDISRCDCVCSPQECDGEDKKWDASTCACHCCPDSSCPYRWYYNTVNCRCEEEPQECAIGYIWYVNWDGSGYCTREPQNCGADGSGNQLFWDMERGECLCVPQPCDADHFWSGFDCKCLCSPPAEPCPDGEYWHHDPADVCGCKAIPHLCTGVNMFWDEAYGETGGCRCRPVICGSSEIFDFDECKCKCEPQTCPLNFYWSEDSCDCICMPPVNCDIAFGDNYFWDDVYCKCVCFEPAGTGSCEDDQYWDHECCECVCSPTPGSVPPEDDVLTFFWNTRTCDWMCNAIECEAGEYWYINPEDATDCECRCIAQRCEDDHYWDMEECCCKCLEQECQTGYYWDSHHCSCQCALPDVIPCEENEYWNTCNCACTCLPPAGGCEDSLSWDETLCSCICAPPPQSEWETRTAAGDWFDVDTCQWREVPGECEWGYFWDFTNGVCVCLDQECPTPYSWDSDNCKCICDDVTEGTPAFADKEDCEDRAGFEWHSDCCDCQVCEPQICDPQEFFGAPRDMFWNPYCCSCQCIPWKECADTYFDHDTCDCAPSTPE